MIGDSKPKTNIPTDIFISIIGKLKKLIGVFATILQITVIPRITGDFQSEKCKPGRNNIRYQLNDIFKVRKERNVYSLEFCI